MSMKNNKLSKQYMNKLIGFYSLYRAIVDVTIYIHIKHPVYQES